MYGNYVVACTIHARRWQHTAVQVQSPVSQPASYQIGSSSRQQRGESSAGRESSSTVDTKTPASTWGKGRMMKSVCAQACWCSSAGSRATDGIATKGARCRYEMLIAVQYDHRRPNSHQHIQHPPTTTPGRCILHATITTLLGGVRLVNWAMGRETGGMWQ
jgi:hypothetical protein